MKEVGYLKLDYLKKIINNNRLTNDSIVIAPTNPRAFKELSILNYLFDLIKMLLANTTVDIIYRPHPSNRNDKETLEIKEKYLTC